METVLLGSFLTQYDAVETYFKEMKPFLTINDETLQYTYLSIFLLKILFVVFAFRKEVEKHFLSVSENTGILSKSCKNPIFREILPNILCTFVILLFFQEPLSISGEFFLDIFMLFFSLKYAIEAYKKELQKLISITFILLFVQWYINIASNTEQFRLYNYLQILALLFLSYFPMKPNNPKYRHRLDFLYIPMYIWVLCKLNQHYCSQYKPKVATVGYQHTELNFEIGKVKDIPEMPSFDINSESICSGIENAETSCYKNQKTVQSNAVLFTSNQEQNTTAKSEPVSEHTRIVSEGIENEDTINTVKSYSVDLKKDYESSKRHPGTLEGHDTEQTQPSVSPESHATESGQETEDKVSEMLEASSTDGVSNAYELNNVNSEFKDNKFYENVLKTENKEMATESEETHFGNVFKGGLESANEALDKEKHRTSSKAVRENKVTGVDGVTDSRIELAETGKGDYRDDETSESNDSNYKPKGNKVLNGKRIILKKQGEITNDVASDVKASELIFKVRSNDSAVQKSTNSKIKPRRRQPRTGNALQGTAGRNLTKVVRAGRISLDKIGHNGTELQIKSLGASKGKSFIKPKKVQTVKLAKTLASSERRKYVADGRDKIKKKDFLTIGESKSNGESEKEE